MQHSHSTGSNRNQKSQRGFVFSLDAAIAVAILASALFLFVTIEQGSYVNPSQSTTITDDLLFALEGTGFIVQTIDTNSPTQSATLIRSKILQYLGDGFDANVNVTSYTVDGEVCAAQQTFEACFPDVNKLTGIATGTDNLYDIKISGKKYFLRKQPPGDCNISYLGLKPVERIIEWYPKQAKQGVLFSPAYFDEGDLNVTFDVNTIPSDVVFCDQNVTVNLSISIPEDVRKAIDLMLVMDRSGSMSWDGQLNLSAANDVFVTGGYAYVADGTAGLRVIDVSDPATPTLSGTYNSPGTVRGIYTVGNYSYLADGTSGLRIADVSDKSLPSSAGVITGIGDVRKVFVSGNYVYATTITDGSTDLHDFNVFGTANVEFNIGRTGSDNNSAAQSFVPTSNTIRRVDVYVRKNSTPGNLIVNLRQSVSGANIASAAISSGSIGTSAAWETADFGTNVAITPGQTYYLVLSKVGSPHASQYYLWSGLSTDPYNSGNAYQEASLQSGTDLFFGIYHRARTGLQVINVSSPSAPVHNSSATGTDPEDVFVSGDSAYFTDGSAGLKDVNITNSQNANTSGSIDTTDATGVYVSGNYAYVADGSAGLRIIDVTNKSSPSITSTYNTPGTATDVVVYSDGNAYVADDTNLQVINVSNPAVPVFRKNYETPYTYTKLDVGSNWAFLVPGYSTGLITFNIYDGPKIDQTKLAAKSFVDFNSWQLPPDQLGLVSFSDNVSLDQTLTTDANSIKSELTTLVANGGTNMSIGITNATAELDSIRHNPLALKFQVLMSDGVSSVDPTAAAQAAEDDDIIIYTIGFGGDADETQLQNVADITGGEYYQASDLNTLQEVFALIALQVAELANDSNVNIPINSGVTVVDDGNGSIMDGNIVFDSGTITKDTPFYASYIVYLPCSSPDICSVDAFSFPGPGTTFDYIGSDGNQHTVDFNDSVTLGFNVRDLQVDITGGEVIGKNNISLDVLVENIGEIDADNTTLRFYLNDTATTPLTSFTVPALCSLQTIGCTEYSQQYSAVSIPAEGVIYTTINDDNSMSECPLYNVDAVNCYGGPQSQVFVVSYDIWRNEQ